MERPRILQMILSGHPARIARIALLVVVCLALTTLVSADVPTRPGVRGTVPDPGTQQQELTNITFPVPYNTMEFPVTCMACHGGTIDQQTGHGGNWAGTSMASAARDPVFRANEMIVNNTIMAATGKNGAGNMCFRCHAPNGWYSGRFDPTLAGDPQGGTMLHSILLSTDDEGVMCEFCHRTLGNVAMKRADLDPNDPVWNMMADIDDWPHSGMPFVDQVGDPTIATGDPYGDGTLQVDDAMLYNGRYSGIVDTYFKDIPLLVDPMAYGGFSPGGLYTGQIYGVYPPGTIDMNGNDVSGLPAKLPDGTLMVHFDSPIGPPLNPNGTPNYMAQSISPEHSTMKNNFIESPEFCGSCHEVTVPVLNHGMPEQRTYTEWKYSGFGPNKPDSKTCQGCHMPRMQHEYNDAQPVTMNADPLVSGWYPYAKSRNNTAVHKLAGANRDLPEMMKVLYPEVDLEVLGAPTGNDPRIFPGMLSDRSTMWDRNQRNTEISLQDAVDVQIVSGPTYNPATLQWEVQVKVINQTGHRIPSGYPDGRRMWIGLQVKDNTGALVYESGFYDPATATLYTDSKVNGSHHELKRALTPFINGDGANNAVMVYERVTGNCTYDPITGDPTACTPSLSLLNDTILFDNRIPPFGFDYAQYRQAGVKFWNYDPVTFVPFEDTTRYANNWDVVTYAFSAPDTAVLTVRAEVYWQTHTRELMDFLKTNDTSTVRPEGPPNIFDPNYPLTPTYLGDVIGIGGLTDLNGQPLNDNWGGIAYAAWMQSNQGAPFVAASAETSAVAPAAPATLAVVPYFNPTTAMVEPYTQQITWDPVVGADGYLVWIKYGLGLTTASWDRLAIVYPSQDADPVTPAIDLLNSAVNVNKTYQFKVQAFNAAGYGPESAVVTSTTPQDLPLEPLNVACLSSTGSSITIAWIDQSDNATGFIVQRQDVPPFAPFATIATIDRIQANCPNPGLGGVSCNWTDIGLLPGLSFNYQLAAFNAVGQSVWSVPPVMCSTLGVPGAPSGLMGSVMNAYQVDLAWTAATGNVSGYNVYRSTNAGGPWTLLGTTGAATTYSDMTAQPNTQYWYQVTAFNVNGESAPSNVVTVTTPNITPAAPSGLVATPSAPSPLPPVVALTWTDNASNETGFVVERADGSGPGLTFAVIATINTQNLNNYVDSTVAPKITYTYRVAAFNLSGKSPYSNEASVVTPGQTPEAPADLRVTGATKSSISLAWLDKSTNEQGFYIERSTDGGNTWTRIATLGVNVSTYTNTKLKARTSYMYRVQAFNADGVSAYSNTITGTTTR